MNRPDPSVDFVGSIRWLMERFDRFEKYVKPLDPEKRMTALILLAVFFILWLCLIAWLAG